MWEPEPDPNAAGCRRRKTARDSGTTRRQSRTGWGRRHRSRGRRRPRYARRLEQDELGDAIRLLLLARPVPRASFAASAELVRLGLATEDGPLLVPRARIVPTEGVYLAFDTFSHGENDPPGWVASFTPTAYWLASLTLRRHVSRALDIGTGNGCTRCSRRDTPTRSLPRMSTRVHSRSPRSAPR